MRCRSVASRPTRLASPSSKYPRRRCPHPQTQTRPLHDRPASPRSKLDLSGKIRHPPSRERIHRYSRAESGGDGLSLLLAIDRVGQSLRQDSFVSDDNGSGAHRADDDDSESEIDESFAVGSPFSEERGALSLCPIDYRGCCGITAFSVGSRRSQKLIDADTRRQASMPNKNSVTLAASNKVGRGGA